jgi:hypothetical protein
MDDWFAHYSSVNIATQEFVLALFYYWTEYDRFPSGELLPWPSSWQAEHHMRHAWYAAGAPSFLSLWQHPV